MSNKKYEFTDETTKCDGHTLHRIRALKTFTNQSKCGLVVHEGDLGGFIEKEENLSQDGTAWVGGNAMVYEKAFIGDDALVDGNNVTVCGNADVWHNAYVHDNVTMLNDSAVYGNARVSGGNGYVILGEQTNIYDSAIIYVGTDNEMLLLGGICFIGGHALIESRKDILSIPDLGLYAWKSNLPHKAVEVRASGQCTELSLEEFKVNDRIKKRFGKLVEPIAQMLEIYFEDAIKDALIDKLIDKLMTANERIRKAIRQSDLSARQISEQTGIKVGTINSWLYTNREPRLANYEKVMAVLNDSKGE